MNGLKASGTSCPYPCCLLGGTGAEEMLTADCSVTWLKYPVLAEGHSKGGWGTKTLFPGKKEDPHRLSLNPSCQ